MGKRAWNNNMGGMGKRDWNSGFSGMGKRDWNSGFSGMGKRGWNSGFTGMGKRSEEEAANSREEVDGIEGKANYQNNQIINEAKL